MKTPEDMSRLELEHLVSWYRHLRTKLEQAPPEMSPVLGAGWKLIRYTGYDIPGGGDSRGMW